MLVYYYLLYRATGIPFYPTQLLRLKCSTFSYHYCRRRMRNNRNNNNSRALCEIPFSSSFTRGAHNTKLDTKPKHNEQWEQWHRERVRAGQAVRRRQGYAITIFLCANIITRDVFIVARFFSTFAETNTISAKE